MYLLDTHTLLWALFKEDFLSVNARKVILDDNDIFVSIVSLWEIAIKQSIGKLEINESIETIAQICMDEDFYILPIKPSHLDHLKIYHGYMEILLTGLLLHRQLQKGL